LKRDIRLQPVQTTGENKNNDKECSYKEYQ
jgi:hypothetical protein